MVGTDTYSTYPIIIYYSEDDVFGHLVTYFFWSFVKFYILPLAHCYSQFFRQQTQVSPTDNAIRGQ